MIQALPSSDDTARPGTTFAAGLISRADQTAKGAQPGKPQSELRAKLTGRPNIVNAEQDRLSAFEIDLSALRRLEKSNSPREMLAHWGRLYDAHPAEPQAFRLLIRAMERAGQPDTAYELLADAPDLADTPQDRVRAAEAISELRNLGRARELFFALLDRDPDNARLMSIFGRYLKGAGDFVTAREVLSEVPPARRSPTAATMLDDVTRTIAALETISPGLTSALPNPGKVLAAALGTFTGRQVPKADGASIGGITFYTGSLGAGGAERQLSRIAIALQARKNVGKPVFGRQLSGGIEVVVNNAEPGRRLNFFRPELEAAGVPVSVVRDMPRSRAETLTDIPADLRDVLPALSSHPRFGLEHLVAHLRRSAPEVLYIWQDGAVLTGALAALIAGVPRIAVSLRGLPPNLRPHLMKPEYREMYRALAAVPGVVFSCNSNTAALAYAAWLDVPADKFAVLYNASQPLSQEASDDEAALWSAFCETAPEGGHTIGGIFRFNENKRWDLWIRAAAARLETHPDDRFILVGSGDERAQAEEAARKAGIESRVLFVGQSRSVGFWLSKMDALVHLSRHEGLPNVLIEAQLAGVPVIATPAGGTSETFEDGQSGLLLPSAEAPTTSDVIKALEALFAKPARRRKMIAAAQTCARERFDLEKTLERSIAFFEGQPACTASAVVPRFLSSTGAAAKPKRSRSRRKNRPQAA